MSLPGVNNQIKNQKKNTSDTELLKDSNPIEYQKKITDNKTPGQNLSVQPSTAGITNDYAGFILSGDSDNNIFQEEKLNKNMKVGLMPKQYFLNNAEYKDLAVKNGMATEQNWNEVAPSLYDKINQMHGTYDVNKFDESPIDRYRKRTSSYEGDFGVVQKNLQIPGEYKNNPDDRFVVDPLSGDEIRIKSDDKSAEDKGIYYDINGKEKNLTKWNKNNSGFSGGNGNFLSLNYELGSGKPVWQEVDGNQEQNTDKIRSYWGPQNMYSNFWSEAGWGLYNSIPGLVGGASGQLHDASTLYGLTETDAEQENINYRNNLFYGYYKHKPSVEAGETGSDANWGQFVGGVGGSVLQMLAFKKFSNVATKNVMGLDPTTATAAQINRLNKAATTTSIAAMSLNGAYATDDMAKNMGVSKEARAYLFFPMALTEYMSERVFGTKFEEGILRYANSQEFNDAIKPIIATVAANQGNKAELQVARKNIMQTLWSGAKKYSGKAVAGKNIGSQAIQEGTEEIIAGRAQNTLMLIHDLGKVANNGNSYFNESKYFYQEDANGNKYQYDKSTGTKERVSDETYEKGVQSMTKPLRKGEGLFGVYEPGMGFSETVGNVFDGTSDDFLGGAFAAGLFKGISMIGNKSVFQKEQQQDYITSQVADGRADIMRSEIMDHIKQGTFGPNDIGEDGLALTAEDIKAGKKSMNQIVGERAIEDINAVEAIHNALKTERGFSDIQKLSEIVGPGAAKFSTIEYINKVRERNGLESANKQLEAELLDDKISTADKELKTKEVADNVIKMKDLSLQIDDIKSGDRNKERIQDNYFRSIAKDNGDLLSIKTEQGDLPVTAENLRLMHERFNQAYENAKLGVEESKSKQADITERTDKLSKDLNSIDITSPDSEGFFNELMALKGDIGKYGTSRENVNKIKNSLEKRKDEFKAKLAEIDPEDFGDLEKLNATNEENEKHKVHIDAFDAINKGFSFDTTQHLDSFEDQHISDEIDEIDAQIKDTEGQEPDPIKDKGRVFDLQKLKNKRNILADHLHAKTREVKLDAIEKETGKRPSFIDGDIVQDKTTKQKGRILDSSTPGAFLIEGMGDKLISEQNLELTPSVKSDFIEGQIKSTINDNDFKADFFDMYLDKQGNNISISNTIADLEKRQLNAEDEILLKRISDALHNNKALFVASKLQQELINDKKYDVGKYGPNSNTSLSKENQQTVANHLAYNEYRINNLKIKQQIDSKDKAERQIRLRISNIKIRSDIANMFLDTYDFGSNAFADLISKNRDLIAAMESNKAKSDTKSYSPEDIIAVNKNLLDLESMMSVALNSKSGGKLVNDLSLKFKAYKGKTDKRFTEYSKAIEFTVGNYEDVYTYEAFSEKHEEGRLYQVSRETFAKTIFVNHLQSLQRLNPKKFYTQYNTFIEETTQKNGNIPSFEQEQMLYNVTAFLNNSQHDLLNQFEDILFMSKTTDFSKNQLFDNMLFVRGFAGAGKTTMIKNALNIHNALSGKKGNVLTSAPSHNLRNTLTGSINNERNNNTQQGLDYDALINFLSSDSSSLINTIIIDEASNWSKAQIKNLNDLVQLKKSAGKLGRINIIFLGDQSQMTSISETESTSRVLPAEAVMERTMPITEIYRSGVADISNLQTAFRQSIFFQSEAILPNGTYDADKNNGLLYFNGNKIELIDKFIDDLNSIDEFKKQNTALIVYSNKERDGFIGYIKQKITNPGINVDEIVKTMEEGKNSAQGLEYGRVYVAITPNDAKALYNRAMLTAVSRAVKTQDHNGFVAMISNAYSEQGDPIVISTKTNTPEDVATARTYYAGILGQQAAEFVPSERASQTYDNGKSTVNPADPKTQTSTMAPTSKMGNVSQEDFDKVNEKVRSLNSPSNINFNNAGVTFVDGKKFRYTINGKPAVSISEVTKSAINYNGNDPSYENKNYPQTIRGSIIHKITERVLSQNTNGGQLFSFEDEIDLINMFNDFNNSLVEYNKSTQYKISELPVLNPGDLAAKNNLFVNSAIKNVSKVFADKLSSKGKFSIPEAIVGLLDNLIAGTIDNIDVVSIDGDTVVVDLYDLKTMGRTAYKNYDGAPSSTGVITTASNTVPYSKKNENFVQLAGYAALLEQGDTTLGLPKMKVRNIVIVKSQVGLNNYMDQLQDEDFVTFDYNSKEFEAYKQIGKDLVGVKNEAKDVKVRINTPQADIVVGDVYKNLADEKVEVTGVLLVNNDSYVELNNFHEIPVLEFLQQYKPYNIQQEKNVGQEMLFASNAIQYTLGQTRSNTFVSQVPGLKENNIHEQIKRALFSKIKSTNLSQNKLNVHFYPNIELTNDSGVKEVFNNVLLSRYPQEAWSNMTAVMKKMSEFKDKSEAQLILEIQNNGYDIMSTFFHADSGFTASEKGIDKNIDFTNEGQVQAVLEKISKGFIRKDGPDVHAAELREYHSHLVNLRAIGAKTDTGMVGQVSIMGFQPIKGYTGRVNYNGESNTFNTFKSKNPNLTFGTPYFDPNAREIDKNGNKVKIASVVIDAWHYGQNLDPVKILFKGRNVKEEDFNAQLKNISELKKNKVGFKEIMSSQPYRFLQWNRGLLKSLDQKSITKDIPGLSELLLFDGTNIEFNKKNFKLDDTKQLLSILEKTYELFKFEFNKGNSAVKGLYYMPPFRIGDNGTFIISNKELSNLETTASSVNQPSMYLNTKAIPTGRGPKVKKTKFSNLNNMDDTIYPMTNEDAVDRVSSVAGESQIENNSEGNDPGYIGLISRFFGNKYNLDNIRKTIALDIVNNYWNTDIRSSVLSLKDVVNNLYEAYQESASEIMQDGNNIIEGIENINSFDQISGDNINLLTPTQAAQFAEYVIGKDRNVFDLFIKKLLPNISSSDLKQRKYNDINSLSNTDKDEERDNETNSKDSQSRSMDDQETRNPFNSISGIVKIALENIQLNTYDKNGVAHPTNRFADFSLIKTALMSAGQSAFSPISAEMDDSPLERIQENVYKSAVASGIGSPVYNSVMSFYDKFFKNNAMDVVNNPETTSDISHFSLINNRDALKLQHANLSEIINSKALESSKLMSAIYTHFGSLVTKNNIYAEKVGKNLLQKSSMNKSYSDIASNLSKSSESSMFENNDGQISAKEFFKNNISGDKVIFDIELSGIKDTRIGKTLIKTNVNNNVVTSFEIPKDVTVDNIKELMALIGFGSIHRNTVKAMLELDEDTVNTENLKIDRKALANALGNLLFAAKASINPNASVFNTVDNLYKKNGYVNKPYLFLSKEEVSDIMNSSDSEKIPGEDMIKPSDLYREIETLANAQSKFTSAITSDHLFNTMGKKVYKHQNGSTIFRLFSQDLVEGKLRSSKLKAEFTSVLENMTYEEAKGLLSPHAEFINDGANIKYYNPFLDPNSGYDVQQVYIADGIDNEYASVKISQNMNETDYANFLINGLFLNDVYHERALQSFKYVFHNPADKKNPITLNLSMSENRDKKIFFTNSKGINYDKAWRFDNVMNTFQAYEHQKNVSIKKWVGFLQMIAEKYQYDVAKNVERISEETTKINDLLAQLVNPKSNSGITPEILQQEIEQYIPMQETVDYKISGNKISIGNAISMDFSNVYTRSKLREIKKLVEEHDINRTQESFDNLNTFIDKIFYHEMDAFTEYLKDIGFKFNENYNGSREFYNNQEGFKRFNPTLESFFYAWHFSDNYISQMAMGSPAYYKGIADYFKRSAGVVAPGNLMDTSNPNGIGPVSNYVILKDEIINSMFHGVDHNNSDGFGVMTGVARNLMVNSTGGKGVSVIGDSMNKFVYFKHNLITGDTKYHKYANLILTDEVINESEWAEEQFRKFIGNDLYAKWNELGRNQDELTKYVIENKLNDSMIHFGVYKSGVKVGSGGIVGSLTEDYTPFVQQADNNYMQIQLNPSQDLTKTKLSAPTQLPGMLMHGSENQEIANNINQYKAALIKLGWDGIKSNFVNPDNTLDVNKFKSFVKTLIQKGSANSSDVSKLSELAIDKDVSLDIPNVRKAVLQYLSNHITNEAIKVPWNGYRMNQAPGFMFNIYEVNGSVFTRKSAAKYKINEDPTNVSRGLKPMRFYTDNNFTQEIPTKEAYFLHIKSGGEVFVKPAEIIMPYAYFEQFGLKETIDNDPEFTLQDVFMITRKDGSLLDLRTVPSDQLNKVITSLFEEEGASGYILDRFKTDDKPIQGDNTIGAMVLEKGQDKVLNEPAIVKAEGWITNFKESLKNVYDRVPTSSSSSAGIGEIIGWIRDNGNTVFTSAEKNIFDGSDYDIDQLSVYFKFLDEQGIPHSNTETKEGIINNMFDNITSYYNNPSNFQMYSEGVSTKKAEDLVQPKIDNDERDFRKSVNMVGANIYYNNKIIEGNDAIGVSANGSKAFVLLNQAASNDQTIVGFNMNPNAMTKNGGFTIKEFELILNAAVDNPKIMALGILDISKNGINVINGMFASGETFEDVIELFDKSHIKSVFAKIKRSEGTDSDFKIGVLEAIDITIDNYVNVDKIAKRRDRMIEALNNKTKALASLEVSEDENNNKRIEKINKSILDLNNKIASINNQIDYLKANKSLNINQVGLEMNPDLLDLLQLKHYAFIGEALNRVNTVVKMDSQGMPVFDYELDKLIRDVEFAINMPLADFVKGGLPSSVNWFEQKKKYIKDSQENTLFGKSKSVRFKENEMAIRGMVDVNKFAKVNPFVFENLKVLSDLKEFMSSSFLRDSKIETDLIESYLEKTKQDWFPTEKAYYSYYKERQKFNTSIFFKFQYGNRLFPAHIGPQAGHNVLNISTATGRYDFNMGFGKYISDLLDRLKTLDNSNLTETEIALKGNPFIQRLQAVPTDTGNFVEFSNAAQLSKDDYANLAFGFKNLPEDLKEQFYIYQLSKDDFEFKQGGLYEAIDNEMFRTYSSFLETMNNTVNEYQNGNIDAALFTFTNANGDNVTINYFEALNDVFLQDASFFSENKILLPWFSSNWKENQIPEFYKEKKRDSANSEYFRLKMIKDDVSYEAKTKNTFNGYDIEESALTEHQVIRRLSVEALDVLYTGAEYTITYRKNHGFHHGIAFIPNGRMVEIFPSAGKIKLKLKNQKGSFDFLKEKETKMDVLTDITKRGTNYLYKKLAEEFLNNENISGFINRGSVSFKGGNVIPEFSGPKAFKGFFKSGNIFLNQDIIKTRGDYEHVFLHELTHDLTTWALELDDSKLKSMDPYFAMEIRQFKDDMGKLYDLAKERAVKDKKITSRHFKNAFKEGLSRDRQLAEFISESFSNPELQRWLHKQEGIEEIEERISLVQSIIKAIGNLFGFRKDAAIHSMLEQVFGVYNKLTENEGIKSATEYYSGEEYQLSERMANLVNLYKGVKNLPTDFSNWTEEDMEMYDKMVRNGRIIC